MTKISDDLKCFIGLHKYTIIDRKPITEDYINKGEALIMQCKNCGKIKIKSVITNVKYLPK